MLRFIIQHTESHHGAVDRRFETIELDVPELEAVLRNGGVGPESCHFVELIGAEIPKEE